MQILPIIVKGISNKFLFVKIFTIMLGAWLILNAIVVDPIIQLGIILLTPIYILICLFIFKILFPITTINIIDVFTR